MRFILIPDSFGGALSSSRICVVMGEKIKKYFLDSLTVSIPVADEGKGSVGAFITAVSGVKGCVAVKDPCFEDMESYFGLIDAGQTAVIEMTSCAGLPLVEGRRDPRLTTTYRVGQLILATARKGMKGIIADLGGPSTSDGGCGAAAAVGVRLYNRDGGQFIPTGGATTDINGVNLSGRDSLLEQVEVVTMRNIGNPMYGPVGASFIFGPQKEADEVMVFQLGEGIRSLSRIIAQTTGTDVNQVPGAGAAGAIDAGMIVFFGSGLQIGVRTVLDTVRFDEIISDADYTLTGEGKLDSQSLRGKVVIGIAERAKKQAKSVIAVVGGAGDDEIGRAYDIGVTAVFPISRLPQGFSVSRYRSQENLAYTVDSIVRFIKVGQEEHQV